MATTDHRIDSYIAEAAAFTQPILRRFRKLVHQANAEIEETIKWSMPFFTYRGAIVCHMAAFQAHCAFGFWRKEIQRDVAKKYPPAEKAMGCFGRVTQLSDLPPDRIIAGYVKQSCALIASGVPRRVTRKTNSRRAAASR